ncbi:MAG: hypothetical protein VKP63_00955 [Cyanobacteriota bacterium]|nr:hypothetical protein [Cyanobacteriota bacterium]
MNRSHRRPFGLGRRANPAAIYDLTRSQFAFIKRLLGPGAMPSLIAKIAQFSARHLAREGLIGLLKRLAIHVHAGRTAGG